MDEQGFREHLVATDRLDSVSIDKHVGKIRIVQYRLGLNLIRQRTVGRKEIYDSLLYTTESKENRHENQNRMKFKVGQVSPTGTPNGYRNAIKEYCKFLDDNVENF